MDILIVYNRECGNNTSNKTPNLPTIYVVRNKLWTTHLSTHCLPQ